MLAGIAVPRGAGRSGDRLCPQGLLSPILQPCRSLLVVPQLALGRLQNIAHDAEVVAVGTLLHDITLNDRSDGHVVSRWRARTLARISPGKAISTSAVPN